MNTLPANNVPAQVAETGPARARAHHRPLHVTHVIHGLEVGGAEKLLLEFARHADSTRFALDFVSLGGDGAIGQQLRDGGWNVTVLGRPAGLCPRLLLRLLRHFRRTRTDVVHTHDIRAHLYGTIAARLAGARVVHTRHGRSDEMTPRQDRLAGLVARWTHHFVCVSHDAAGLATRRGIPSRRLSTIWNGIDLGGFQYQIAPVDGPVVTVARLSPEKDLGVLLHATAIAARRDAALRLEIAGDGPCRAELLETAARLGLSGRVRFLGAVADVAGLLSRAGVFVLPSRSEGIALTILEAQACGVAVVATRVGGNAEIIADGETGILVPSGNAEALAQAILKLRGDPALRRRLACAGRSRVAQHFDVRQMVACYEKLYETCPADTAAAEITTELIHAR